MITQTAKRPTSQELAAGLAIIRAVADTVRELGRSPRGPIYSALMGRGVSLDAYQTIERILVNGGLVLIEADCLVWLGPK